MLENKKHFESVPGIADRRTHTRIQVRSLAYIELDQVNGGLILNISEVGIAIQAVEIAGFVFPNMRFRLPKSEKWTEASGKLVWEGKSRKEAGIQFVNLSEDVRQQIQSWIYSAAFRPGLPVEQGRFKIVWEAEEPKPAAEDFPESEVPPEFVSVFPSEKSLPKKPVPADFSPSAASRFKAAAGVDQARARGQDSLGTALSDVAAPSVGAGMAREAEKLPGPPQPFDPLSEAANTRSLRAACRPPESPIGNPVSSEPTVGRRSFSLGYQPTPFEEPSGKG